MFLNDKELDAAVELTKAAMHDSKVHMNDGEAWAKFFEKIAAKVLECRKQSDG